MVKHIRQNISSNPLLPNILALFCTNCLFCMVIFFDFLVYYGHLYFNGELKAEVKYLLKVYLV